MFLKADVEKVLIQGEIEICPKARKWFYDSSIRILQQIAVLQCVAERMVRLIDTTEGCCYRPITRDRLVDAISYLIMHAHSQPPRACSTCYLRQYLEVTVQTVIPIYNTYQPVPSSATVSETPARKLFLLFVHNTHVHPDIVSTSHMRTGASMLKGFSRCKGPGKRVSRSAVG